MTEIFVHSRSIEGHHAEYNLLLEKELKSLGVTVVFWSHPIAAIAARRVFFSMIDGNWSSFILCVFLSCVTGQRVGGLFFRAGECFRPGLKHRVKYRLFRALKLLPGVKILTIMPFSVDPRFAEIADDWSHDPQLWDRQSLVHLASDASTPLSVEVRNLAKGRALIVALGAQSRGKGFDYLCDVWRSSAALRERYLIVAAGKVTEELREEADRLRARGGVVIDRFITAQELSSLYATATLVWAAYHPDYDQASGIVGRAFQFGVPLILRHGSYMASLMRDLGHASVEIAYGDPTDAAERVLKLTVGSDRRIASAGTAIAMRRRFMQKVSESLNLDEAVHVAP